jgi:2-polyprenyl-3-methyl-5-hydroxy-6-metoxy-1,4-benzoquinol methylase
MLQSSIERESLQHHRLPPLPVDVPAGRIPKWVPGETNRRNCPTCKADAAAFVIRRPDDLDVHRCDECEMLYLADVPAQNRIDEFYHSYANYKGLWRARKMSWLRRAVGSARDPFLCILEKTGGVKGLEVLDFGCSYGDFLQRARHLGARVHGIELDEGARQFLKQLGIPVAERLKKDRQYDVICLFQVLEHLFDPAAVIASCSESLALGGRILISVPNAGEVEKIGHSWVGFRVDLEHINYFNVRTLSRLLQPFGLYIEHFWEHFQPNIIPAATTRFGRLCRTIKSAIFESSPHIFTQGTFGLTVLARKCNV